MHRTRQQNRFPINKVLLVGIILLLAGILVYRTSTYFKQLEVQTTQAVLKNGPGIEYQQRAEVPQGTRLTVIKTKYHWLYVKTGQNKFGWVADWMISPNYTQPIKSLKNATIVLDPGHGGNDSGAVSTHNTNEKTYTLRFAKEVAKKLREKGAKVYLTRNKDTYVSLAARPRLAEQVHADAFISFHFDSAPETNVASGYTTYYYHQKSSLSLAKKINNSFGALALDNRGVDFGDFLVIRDNTRPSILLEMGYINSERDFEQISSRLYKNKVSTQIVAGLEKYFANK